jgi:uncharacterized membrane protein
MSRARAAIELDAQISAAEALWYDVTRWPAFVDGFGHVDKLEGPWPDTGARVLWDSTRGGRGRVVERVVAYEVRTGQTVEVEDPKTTGTQRVRFTPREGGGARMELELEYRLKDRTPFTPLVDAIFVRRAFNDALRRTLARFQRELAMDVELEAETAL